MSNSKIFGQLSKQEFDDVVSLLEAREIYNRSTDNDPLIHCNRFPSWEELLPRQRRKLMLEYRLQGKLK